MKPLWAHQLACLERSKDVDHLGLLLDVGVGKTRTAIEILKQKTAQEGRRIKTLIVGPSCILFNWKSELSRYWPELDMKHVIVLTGTGVERRRMLDRTPNYFIVIANYESLLMDSVYLGLKDWGPECIIADESQRIKSIKAMRTKRLLGLAQYARFKYILSGSPVVNNEMDIFSQFLFLDSGQTFGKSFFNFRNLWFTDENAQARRFNANLKWPKWVNKKHKIEEFRAKVMSKAVSVTKAECLDLPPYIQQSIEVGMTKEQKRAYDEMKSEYITFVNSSAFSAELAIVKALRLLQISAGFLMNTDGVVHNFKDTPKDKALLELLEDIPGKSILWTPWIANQRHLRDLLTKKDITFRELIGGQNPKERDDNVNQFTEDPDVKVLIASPAAGGVGLNLVAANVAIYYARNFSFELDYQSAARIHRGGQTATSVTRYDLVVPGTIDQGCMEAVSKKEDIHNTIINGHLLI